MPRPQQEEAPCEILLPVMRKVSVVTGNVPVKGSMSLASSPTLHEGKFLATPSTEQLHVHLGLLPSGAPQIPGAGVVTLLIFPRDPAHHHIHSREDQHPRNCPDGSSCHIPPWLPLTHTPSSLRILPKLPKVTLLGYPQNPPSSLSNAPNTAGSQTYTLPVLAVGLILSPGSLSFHGAEQRECALPTLGPAGSAPPCAPPPLPNWCTGSCALLIVYTMQSQKVLISEVGGDWIFLIFPGLLMALVNGATVSQGNWPWGVHGQVWFQPGWEWGGEEEEGHGPRCQPGEQGLREEVAAGYGVPHCYFFFKSSYTELTYCCVATTVYSTSLVSSCLFLWLTPYQPPHPASRPVP